MDYAIHIVVEKVAISSQEVIKRDTITSYALQCPTSIVELGLRHAEQIALLEKVQNIVLAEQSRLLDPGMPVCPTCGNTLKKNGYKTSNFHAVFSDHTVCIQKHHCSQPGCGWHSTPTVTSLFGTNIHPDLATIHLPLAYFGSSLRRIGSLILKNKELPMLVLLYCRQLPIWQTKGLKIL